MDRPTHSEIQAQWFKILSQLSRYCGSAKCPDRDLDLRIAVALGDDLNEPIRPYTSSLEEAARTLPPGSQATVTIYADHTSGEAHVYGQSIKTMNRHGRTDALSLCMASMQYRACLAQHKKLKLDKSWRAEA